MRPLLAALLIGLALAACAADTPPPSRTTSSTVSEPAEEPSTMRGSGEYAPAPEAYRRLCEEMPEACE
jgi:hypothetical protein